MTSDTIKTAMTGNMHCIWMSGQVIDAIELDSQVKSDHRGRLGDHNELPILCRSHWEAPLSFMSQERQNKRWGNSSNMNEKQSRLLSHSNRNTYRNNEVSSIFKTFIKRMSYIMMVWHLAFTYMICAGAHTKKRLHLIDAALKILSHNSRGTLSLFSLLNSSQHFCSCNL